MSKATQIVESGVSALRAVLPTLRDTYSDMPVRFLANNWSPIRVIDETNEESPKIWLRALNIDVLSADDGYVIRVNPRRYAGSMTAKEVRARDKYELIAHLDQIISPYRI